MSLVEIKSNEAKLRDNILELQEIFAHFDKSGSEGSTGAISIEKLGEVLRESLGLSFGEEELADMIAAIDLNGSGDIYFAEFMKMMDTAKHDADLLAGDKAEDEDDEEEEKKSEEKAKAKAAMDLQLDAEYVVTRDDIKAIFQKFDTDKDGFVSYGELRAMLAAHNEGTYADEEVHAMIHLVDPSNSGMISYQAFVRLMLSPED